ncbi:hypothetical protein [Microbacterium deminutum]|uniref:Uncharacterized protein n=1 Tax=Microbacterium deminutum TaxID=344164 RepID=A0ABP5CWA8_9MICO
MNKRNAASLELARTVTGWWFICDRDYRRDDARFVVAWMHEVDIDDVEVMWTGAVPLPTRYVSADTVLDDLIHFCAGSGSERPIPIPHFPPLVAA